MRAQLQGRREQAFGAGSKAGSSGRFDTLAIRAAILSAPAAQKHITFRS